MKNAAGSRGCTDPRARAGFPAARRSRCGRGDASERVALDLQRRLTTFLERRIPPWVEALEAENGDRRDAIRRLLQSDAEAPEHIPPVVLLGTVAIGYRVIETEIRLKSDAYGYSADELWAEVDLLRRTVLEMRRDLSDGDRVA